ncbi:MAG TPA: response regulator [Edaphobacter sp.]|nr:response regulator [Edaphobacter sp.]
MSSTYRILLVEDSETQALRLEFLFAEQGWQTERASTAEEAVYKLKQIVPDLIIVDHYLPGLKGVELCKLIRLNPTGWNSPILMFTAEDAAAVQRESLESGADDYLSKSAGDSILLLRVRALLRKSETNRRAVRQGDTVLRQAQLLAVDDSPSYLEHLVHELSSDGHAVETATNGPDALDKIKTRGYDCVVLDLVMPGMDGIEVCRAISLMGADLPCHPLVLMLTGHENPGEMARGLENGADDFVGKSSDVTVLRARVHALLRRKLFQDALKDKEIEILRANAAREAAELKAALVSQITQKNSVLEETNRKLKETQMHLVHSANMASLGQLVAGIAHEINNPIAFIDNNCYLIKEKLEDLADGCDTILSPAQKKLIQSGRERLSETRMGLERVKELVSKLRTFSRLDEGEFKTINVHESIESVLVLLQHRNRRIEVDKQFGGDRMLDCAPGQLNQVLMNLLANAIDAIDGRPGKITIRTGVEEGWYSISVRDSGPGVPASIQSRVFQPFFTTKPVGSGTGLGLAISHSIMQAHKGHIEVLSPEGGGAEFRIRIPLDLNEKVVHAIHQG